MGEATPDMLSDFDVDIEVPVLIVGGGPTGLFQSFLLSKLGVQCLVIERYLERLGAPKAHALNPRSLEACRQYGLDVGRIRALGTRRGDASWVNFIKSLGGESIGRLPYERMDVEVLQDTPEMIHNIPQPAFQHFIETELASESNVEIRKGLSFLSTNNTQNGILTTVEVKANGHKLRIKSDFVVACDGANSKVRDFLGIQSEGEPSIQTMMTIHFKADVRPIIGDRLGMLHWIMNPAGAGFIIGYDLSGNMVHISNYDTDRIPTESWTEDRCRKILRGAFGQDIPFEILSFRPWIFRRKIANHYRVGNVFLAGDAAHSFPPTGGLGLNCGLADVHNLAFKIAAVCHGWANDSILDSYQAERRHVANMYSKQSVKNGIQIFNLLKSTGTAHETDLVIAQENLNRALRDPQRRKIINEGIEGQREHFDNLEHHIGYVYTQPPIVPPNASNYEPKFMPGARLPHAWIQLPLTSTLPTPPYPVDLSYIPDNELLPTSKRVMRYSTLDLCAPDAFTFIFDACSGAQTQLVEQVRRHYKFRGPKINMYHLGRDFELVDTTDGGGDGSVGQRDRWIRGLRNTIDDYDADGNGNVSGNGSGNVHGVITGLLVRPDQHILMRLDDQSSTEKVLGVLKGFLGL